VPGEQKQAVSNPMILESESLLGFELKAWKKLAALHMKVIKHEPPDSCTLG
jgi:hypothetical protein